MKRVRTMGIQFLSVLALVAASPLHAASPYDDYYDSYQQPENGAATAAAPIDNDAYYSAPGGQYPTDNDAYYSAPGSYSSGYATQEQASGGSNCNTIGDMPSCGSD